MSTKSICAVNRLGDFLREYPELNQDDRRLVRQILQKATYLEFARLLADPELEPGLEAVRQDDNQAQNRTLSNPTLIALGLVGLIALVAAACAVLQ